MITFIIHLMYTLLTHITFFMIDAIYHKTTIARGLLSHVLIVIF